MFLGYVGRLTVKRSWLSWQHYDEIDFLKYTISNLKCAMTGQTWCRLLELFLVLSCDVTGLSGLQPSQLWCQP